MKLLNGQLVMEMKDCSNCEHGLVAGRQPCPKCDGSGRGPRGKHRGCKVCNGYGTKPDFVNKVPCKRCQGNYLNSELETLCDYVPQHIWMNLEFRVYRSNREQTWNEAHLGFGCVYSMSDYGAHKSFSDDELIAKVRKETGVQATKITKDNTICHHIGIFTSDNGYSVRAVFEASGQRTVAAHEANRSTHDG